MSIIDTAKEHPLMTAGIVVVVGLGTLWLMSSSSNVAATAQPNYAATGTQMNDALSASQMHSADLSASLQAQAAHDTSLEEIARISLQAFNANEQTKQYEISKSSDVALANIESVKSINVMESTLNAQVRQQEINAAIQNSQIAANTQVSLAQSQAQTQGVLVSALTASQDAATRVTQQVYQQQIASQERIQTQSWWDRIFG